MMKRYFGRHTNEISTVLITGSVAILLMLSWIFLVTGCGDHNATAQNSNRVEEGEEGEPSLVQKEGVTKLFDTPPHLFDSGYINKQDLCLITRDGKVIIWDTKREEAVARATIELSTTEHVRSAAFPSNPGSSTGKQKRDQQSAENSFAVLTVKDHNDKRIETVKLFKKGKGKPVREKTFSDKRIRHIRFSNAGKYLWVFGDQTYRLKTANFDLLDTSNKGCYSQCVGAEVSPEGNWIIISVFSVDGELVRRWQVKDDFTFTNEVNVIGRLGTSYALDFSPDGEHLAVGANEELSEEPKGRLKIFDVSEINSNYDDKTDLEREFEKLNRGVLAVTYSPSGKQLAFCDGSGTIRIRNMKNGNEISKLKLFEMNGRESPENIQIHFSSGERSLIIGVNKRVYLWNYGG